MEDPEAPTEVDAILAEPAEPAATASTGDPAPPRPRSPWLVDATTPVLGGIDRWWAGLPDAARTAVRWGAPAAVIVTAAATRLVGLGSPHELVFDETYYVKDAWSLRHLGFESGWPDGADERFAAGETDIWTGTAAFVVHPPLGKWIIGLGMAALGADDPASWRISMAILGILSVVLVMVAGRLLTGSLALATIAGGLMAIDGNAIVMSRIGILDNALSTLALLGFLFVVLDRRWAQRRLDAWLLARDRTARAPSRGPVLWWRPWLIAAGVALGAASAVKWSGFTFLAAFGILTVVSDLLMRRAAGVEGAITGTLLRQAPVSALLLVPPALATHMASWIGWFRSDGGYHRHWAEQAGNAWTGALAWVPTSLQSWWHFQVVTVNYHVGESREHSYQADAWMWPLLIRPTSFWFQSSARGERGCGADECWAQITDLPNPIIWWAATAAIVFLIVQLVRGRAGWPALFVVAGFAAGWVPWLCYPERTIFQFYAIAFEPYMVLALAMAIGAVAGSRRGDPDRRRVGVTVVIAFLGVAALASVFFWPVWTGEQLEPWQMALRWWLPSWR